MPCILEVPLDGTSFCAVANVVPWVCTSHLIRSTSQLAVSESVAYLISAIGLGRQITPGQFVGWEFDHVPIHRQLANWTYGIAKRWLT